MQEECYICRYEMRRGVAAQFTVFHVRSKSHCEFELASAWQLAELAVQRRRVPRRSGECRGDAETRRVPRRRGECCGDAESAAETRGNR